jgi:hypothetical protein
MNCLCQARGSFRNGIRLLALCALICCISGPAQASGEIGPGEINPGEVDPGELNSDKSNPGDPKESAIGVSVGIPHTLALTYERYLGSHLAARVHIGSAVLLSSAGARIQWGQNRTGFRPYVFAGAAWIHSVPGDYGDPEGVTGYFWLGPGVSLRQDRWEIYTEASALLGGDEDGGLGHDWIFPFSPAITAGLMLRF